MQAFLPYADFEASARVLDVKRLGKQRSEALIILRALDGRIETYGWRNHPAVIMWRGYPLALMQYTEVVCTEWVRRGYRDSVAEKVTEMRWHGLFLGNEREFVYPHWLGDEAFHRAHQSNLVRKDEAHYGPLFPGVPDDLPYIWPDTRTMETK